MKSKKLIKTTKILDTRFGNLTIDSSKEINFPAGIIGLADLKKYALVDLYPKLNFQDCKILQSIEDQSISFITFPITHKANNFFGGMIHQNDIFEACELLNINEKNLALVLIINFKKNLNNETKAFINIRAPIFIDSHHLIGYQYILPNNIYEISKALEI